MGPQITQIALMDEENTADAGNTEHTELVLDSEQNIFNAENAKSAEFLRGKQG